MIEQNSNIAFSNVKPACVGASRISSLDVIKCFAAFCVVWIHFGSSWLSPITRCAVPIFFIITGYYYPIMIEKGSFWRHIKKLLMMALFSSALYGVWELQYQIHHDTLAEWISNNIRLRNILGMLYYNEDMFVFVPHLWYFYAVLYDLIIFYFADKWKMTKWLRYAVPILLLFHFIGNFTPWAPKFRNFLFMGLPCMMIGRSIREKKDKKFCVFSKQQYMWIYTFISLMMMSGEMWLYGYIYPDNPNKGIRNMYIFTLPLLLPYFYWALRNPSFGKESWLATIGRKYSAYIYIFHILVANLLPNILESDTFLLSRAIFPFLVFGISLCISWLYVRMKQLIKTRI